MGINFRCTFSLDDLNITSEIGVNGNDHDMNRQETRHEKNGKLRYNLVTTENHVIYESNKSWLYTNHSKFINHTCNVGIFSFMEGKYLINYDCYAFINVSFDGRTIDISAINLDHKVF